MRQLRTEYGPQSDKFLVDFFIMVKLPITQEE